MRRFVAREVPYLRRNYRYSVSQMLLALVYPIVLGLDRIETASFLRSNGTCDLVGKCETGRRGEYKEKGLRFGHENELTLSIAQSV